MARNFRAISSTSAFAVSAVPVGRLLHLQAVLVRAGHEEDVVAVERLNRAIASAATTS